MSGHTMKLKINKRHGFNSVITINAPKDQVWAVLKDFNNVYTWAPGVSESHALGKKNQEVGAARFCKLADFGNIDEVITEWKQGEGFTYTVSPLGPLNNAASRWTLTEVDSKTTRLEVEFAYDIRFGVFGKMMHRLVMQKKLHTSLPQTLDAFKHRIETKQLIRPYKKEQSAAAN